jgi:hypothetical protein
MDHSTQEHLHEVEVYYRHLSQYVVLAQDKDEDSGEESVGAGVLIGVAGG